MSPHQLPVIQIKRSHKRLDEKGHRPLVNLLRRLGEELADTPGGINAVARPEDGDLEQLGWRDRPFEPDTNGQADRRQNSNDTASENPPPADKTTTDAQWRGDVIR